MDLQELKIGEIAVINGVKVKCFESSIENFIGGCSDCYFNGLANILCCAGQREDNTRVYFKKIEDGNE